MLGEDVSWQVCQRMRGYSVTDNCDVKRERVFRDRAHPMDACDEVDCL